MKTNCLMKFQNPKAVKHFLTFFLLCCFIGAGAQDRFPAKPSPERLVNDFANVLSDSQERTLERKLIAYNDTTSTQILIVTISELHGEDPNLYAAELGEAWGIGQEGKDNGIVILVSYNDRKMSIQTGYGIESTLTDALAKRIIEQNMIPSFRNDDYYQGLQAGTTQIIKVLSGQYKGQPRSGRDFPWSNLLFVIVALIIIVASRRRGNGRGGSGGIWIMGSTGSGFGGSSGGGSSFGGFGGGSFGGGGASGSW